MPLFAVVFVNGIVQQKYFCRPSLKSAKDSVLFGQVDYLGNEPFAVSSRFGSMKFSFVLQMVLAGGSKHRGRGRKQLDHQSDSDQEIMDPPIEPPPEMHM